MRKVKAKNFEEIICYVDGSADNRPGHRSGGWAFLVKWRGKEIIHYGHAKDTSSNEMELMSVIRALQFIKPTKHLPVLHLDSAYAKHCLTVWHHTWQRNGWINSEGKDVSNRKLIERGIALLKAHGNRVLFRKVKGHSKQDNEAAELNHKVDRAAHEARVQKITNFDEATHIRTRP